MNYLVQYDENGSIDEATKKPAPRGRTPQGWTRVDENGNPVQPKGVAGSPKIKTVTPGLTSLLVQIDENGELVIDKFGDMVQDKPKKGRPKKGWMRVQSDENGDLYDMSGKPLFDSKPDKKVEAPDETTVEEPQDELVIAGDSEAEMEKAIAYDSREIPAQKRMTLVEFQKHVDAARTQDTDTGVSMLACTIEAEPNTGYLSKGMLVSRIDADGCDIKVWREKPKGQPTIVIKGVLEV